MVALGGALGAVVRYGISLAIHAHVPRFPLGTLVVNTLGCLLVGVFMYFAVDRPAVSANARMFLVVGFLGAMTTFSSFSFETLALVRQGHVPLALLNIGANLGLCLLAAWAGWAGARHFFGG
jgi:fluoride exporter